ncbi:MULTISPECIES: AlpA family phage regulatory protein [unclassified Halomonas]|uniref:helix-turn-helix transcriptional regulator n=1 Tax=unclassified Halomonas TaxID=2609666 RepID=UPI001EF5704B|nr:MULTISPECIES: AlpA family phage regulatory protein [unclassified Halomonas]MCG7577344.1 AlpA family transcriptional regulator [Halomonas sp. MMH1-48]MCG7604409.1 AlpA family transcriptional regulator [Halomonas sp. MM17-34]MCG7613582.1 AlpA family transcriptional regulator [Halomonas sp. MM17-29]MCG7620432.1 AlpA family transcriptional regulator [Halomonas sp. DSH1-27]
MSDKIFSPPPEELRARLLALSGQCERLVREPDRRAITGVSRTQWWSLERKQVAPARLKLGCNSVAWRLSDLLAWIEQQGA